MQEEEIKENNPIQAGKKSISKTRIFLRVLLVVLLLFLALPFSLYIPVVQDFVCQHVVMWLNMTSDDLEFQVGQVRLGFPLRLSVNDVAVLKRKDGQPLISLGSLQTGLDDIPWEQPYFVVNKLEVRDVVLGMDSLTQSLGIVGNIAQLDIKRIEIDPSTTQLRAELLHLHDPNLNLYLGPSVEEPEEESQSWNIAVKQVEVHDGRFALDISDECLSAARTRKSASPYVDYNHLDLDSITISAHDILYGDSVINLVIDEIKAQETYSGVQIRHLATSVALNESRIHVGDLDLQLGNKALLKGDVDGDLGILDSLHNGYLNAKIQCNLDAENLLKIGSPYLPGLSAFWEGNQLTFYLDGRVTTDSLDLRTLSLRIDDNVDLRAEAFGLYPFNDDKRSLAATLKSDLAHADYLLSVFDSPAEKREYRLPDSLSLDLEASQQEKLFSARLAMHQNANDVLGAEGTYQFGPEKYHLSANLYDFDVSQFVPSVIAKDIFLNIQADGQHFRFPSKYSSFNAKMHLDSLSYTWPDGKQDIFSGLNAEASLDRGNYIAQIVSDIPCLKFDSHLEGIYLKDTVSVSGYLNVDHIELANLPAGLAQPDFGVIGFRSHMAGHYNWGDYAQAALRIDSLRYDDGQAVQHFDSILMTLESEPGMLYADMTGGDAVLCLNTEKTISELPKILSVMGEEVGKQLTDLRFDFNAIQQTLPQGQVDFHMAQKNPFYPAINYMGYSFRSIDISAYNLFDLNLDAAIIGLKNHDRTIDFDSILTEIRPCKYLDKADASKELHGYRFAGNALHVDPKARDTYNIHASGLLMPDSLKVDFNYVDGNFITLYDAAASLSIGNDTVTFRLEKDPVIFAQPFTVNKDNFISLMEYRNAGEHHRTNSSAKVLMEGPRGMSLDAYTRKAKNQEIGNQMLVRLQNLDLNYVAHTIKWDENIDGRLNMTATANLFPDSLGGRIRMGINAFRLGEYKADTLSFDGALRLAHARKDVTGQLTIDDIVKFQLTAALADTVNLQADVTELPLPLVNLFLPDNINLYGNTTGHFSLLGKDIESSRLDAYITMHDGLVNVSDLDANLRLPADTIRIRNNRLVFNDYNLYGANASPLTLRGNIDMRQNLTDPMVDLRIQGDKVQLIDSRRLRLKGQYIYGRLPLNVDIRVKGKSSKLDVNGNLKVLSGTNLNYYLQDDPLQANSKVDQLVEFISFRQMDRELAHSEFAPLVNSAEEGTKMEFKIDIDKDVRVNAYLPGTDNNRVTIVGGGPLIMQGAPDGSMTMSGVYDVTSGTVDYKLPVLPMTKKFNILNSSNVSWNGTDPANPIIDIQASESVRATVNDAQGTRLVNFIVTINITGTLEALDMSFTCSSPEDGTVNAEIESMTDEDRSKAALMLLIAQTYLAPGGNNDVGMGTANAALNSVLNREMNQFIGSKLKNTDVDLGIDTYSSETGNARTDYSIKVSQRFFNDRFRATIGGRVSSGGDPAQRNGARLGDLSLEWLIKKDGSHYLKLYRRYNYESVFEGEVLETGIGYAQERSAYKFKHLLIPTSKSRQARILSVIKEMRRAEEMEAEDSESTTE